MHAHMQVRRAMYTSSLERWKAYKEFLPPLLRPLRDLILQYEAEAGCPRQPSCCRRCGGPLHLSVMCGR